MTPELAHQPNAVQHPDGVNTPLSDPSQRPDGTQHPNGIHADEASHVDGSNCLLGFRIGDRIEVYWTKEQQWFAGSIVQIDLTGHK